jgi:pyrroloquinoline quinone (PQQ) biosynthesis protein C
MSSVNNAIDKIFTRATTTLAVKHIFLDAIREGKVCFEAMGYIIKGYVEYSKMFPGLIARILEEWQNDHVVRKWLGQLLEEELSSPSTKFPHHKQLDICADSFNIAFDRIKLKYFKDECTAYGNIVSSIVQSNKYIALGMLGPGTEHIVPDIYNNFIVWFKSQQNADLDYRYFLEHVEADKAHSRYFYESICAACTSSDKVTLVDTGLNYATDQRVKLWDSLMFLSNEICTI